MSLVRAVYIDESEAPAATEYYMGALIVDPEALVHIERDMDRLVGWIADEVPTLPREAEIHAYEVFHGRGPWQSVRVELRVKVCETTARIIRNSGAHLMFRGVDANGLEQRYTRPHPIHELTLAHLLTDLDRRLGPGKPLGRLAICHADEHHAGASSRRNLRRFKVAAIPGFNDHVIQNIGDTLYFGPSSDSRLLQAVDVATFFWNRSRNAVESDPRAIASMERIMADLTERTLTTYVWDPLSSRPHY